MITVIYTVKTTPSFCVITTISKIIQKEKMPEMMWLLQSLEGGVNVISMFELSSTR